MLSRYFRNLKIGFRKTRTIAFKAVLIFRLIFVNVKSRPKTTIPISMTSFGQRISTIQWTLISLLVQTIKVNKIFIWIYEKDSHLIEKNRVLSFLVKLFPETLEVQFVTIDLKPHKKYYYMNSSAPFITADDDILYPLNAVKYIVNEYKRNCGVVICNVARVIPESGITSCKYSEMPEYLGGFSMEGSHRLIAIGAGLVLYPYFMTSLHTQSFFNIISTYGLLVDDLVLKTAELRHDLKIRCLDNYTSKDFHPSVFDEGLKSINIGKNNNDNYFESLNEKLLSLFDEIEL